MTGIVVVSVSAKNKIGLAIIGPIIGIRAIISSPPLINLSAFSDDCKTHLYVFVVLKYYTHIEDKPGDAEYILITEKL